MSCPTLSVTARVTAATPPDRDRVVDLVRVVCMFTVAFGHWLVAAVTVTADGQVEAASVLAAVPATQWVTWALQVMGLFFAVSGFASAASLRRRPGDTSGWIRDRLVRVMTPTAVYVACWAVTAPLLLAVLPTDVVRAAASVVAVQLWFVAVIVLLFAATPWLWRAWNRYGWPAPAVASMAALVVDVAHRIGEVPLVGWANFALVWSVPTLVGFAWHDGRLLRWRWWLLTGGTVALVSLVATPWLPASMVGVDGAAQSNNSPPSSALIALTCIHVGLVLIAGPALRRWLDRPKVWTAVVLAGRAAMTTYLWHLSALVIAVGLLMVAGGSEFTGPVGSATWWAWRPVWLGVLALLAAPLVRAALPAELAATRASTARTPAGPVRVCVAVVVGCAGAAGLALAGFAPQGVWALPGGINAGVPLLLGAATAVGAWPVRRPVRRPDGLQDSASAPAVPAATHGNVPAGHMWG